MRKVKQKNWVQVHHYDVNQFVFSEINNFTNLGWYEYGVPDLCLELNPNNAQHQ